MSLPVLQLIAYSLGSLATSLPTADLPTADVAVPAASTVSWIPAAGLPSPGAAALAPLAAPQDGDEWDFSYSFFEVGATRLDLEEVDDTADTYYGTFSLGLFSLAYVFLGYENGSTDFDNTDTDTWSLGAGIHFDLSNRVDLVGDVAWLYSDLSGDTLDEDSNGHRVRIGARWLPIEFAGGGGLEISGHALWMGLEDSYFSDDDITGFDVGARVHILEALSIGAVYTSLEDDDAGALNVRFSF